MIGGEQVFEFKPPEDVVQQWERDIHPDVFDGADLY